MATGNMHRKASKVVGRAAPEMLTGRYIDTHTHILITKDATMVQKFGDRDFQIREAKGINHYCVENGQEVTRFACD